MEGERIDPKLIEGLHFYHAVRKEPFLDEGAVRPPDKDLPLIPAKRQLKPEEVLSWRQNEDGSHSIVTASGQMWKRTEHEDRIEFTRQGVFSDFYVRDENGKHVGPNKPIVVMKKGKAA